MQANQSILSQYPANGSKYVDPMYVPYQRVNIPLQGPGCSHPVNTWKRHGSPFLASPEIIRKGWYSDFQRVHSNDPCPAGWRDMGNGFCTRVHQEGHESNFYTSEQFRVEYQYHDGYTVNPKDKDSLSRLNDKDRAPTFQDRSVNPHTGKYVVYHDNKPNLLSQKYGRNPARHSYLGK